MKGPHIWDKVYWRNAPELMWETKNVRAAACIQIHSQHTLSPKTEWQGVVSRLVFSNFDIEIIHVRSMYINVQNTYFLAPFPCSKQLALALSHFIYEIGTLVSKSLLQATRLAWRGLAGRQRPKMYFCLLRKLGGSGSPGQLLQQQQTEKVS